MRKLIAIALVLLGNLSLGRAQAPDTTRSTMPAIELPEITIVGKKAITLPFARKGEIFDVNIYEAPAPDSSFLISRPQLPLPVGEYTRLAERVSPWNGNVGGGLGNLGLTANGSLGLKMGMWDMFAKGDYSSTDAGGGGEAGGGSGIVLPLQTGSATHAGLKAGVLSILSTDNDLLKSLQFSLNGELGHEAYIYYPGYMLVNTNGIGPNPIVRITRDRVRNGGLFGGSIGSVQQKGFVFSLGLSSRLSSVNDDFYHGFSIGSEPYVPAVSVSVSEPKLQTSIGLDISRFRFAASLFYSSASLNYVNTVQSPSLLAVTPSLQWKLTERLTATAGVFTGYGSGSDKGNYSLFLPSGSLRWELDGYREFSVWWQPEMHLVSYDSLMRRDPWLNPELVIRPERTPVSLGAAFSFTTKAMSLAVRGSYKQSSNHPVIRSEGGSMDIVYGDAVVAAIDAEGMLAPISGIRLTYGGTFQRATADSGDTQLPMTPSLAAYGKAEYYLSSVGLNLFGRLDYTGKQNVDFAAARTIEPYVLVSVGASMNVYSKLVVSFDAVNIANVNYLWLEGYRASGVQGLLSAKWTLR